MDPIPPNGTPSSPFGFAVFTYVWVIVLSIWGGVVNYIHKVRSGQCARFNITELMGDVCPSGFVGLLTFWLCQAAHFNELLTAVFVGVSGHMGARSMLKLEAYMAQKIGLTQNPPTNGNTPT